MVPKFLIKIPEVTLQNPCRLNIVIFGMLGACQTAPPSVPISVFLEQGDTQLVISEKITNRISEEFINPIFQDRILTNNNDGTITIQLSEKDKVIYENVGCDIIINQIEDQGLNFIVERIDSQ